MFTVLNAKKSNHLDLHKMALKKQMKLHMKKSNEKASTHFGTVDSIDTIETDQNKAGSLTQKSK